MKLCCEKNFTKDSLARHWARDWRALALTQVHHGCRLSDSLQKEFEDANDAAPRRTAFERFTHGLRREQTGRAGRGAERAARAAAQDRQLMPEKQLTSEKQPVSKQDFDDDAEDEEKGYKTPRIELAADGEGAGPSASSSRRRRLFLRCARSAAKSPG